MPGMRKWFRGGEVGSMDLKGVEGRIEGEYDKTHHMVFSKKQ